MASSLQTSPTKPEATVLSTPSHLQPEPLSNVDLETGNRASTITTEFDPCSNAPFTSPFYNHDSPRVSSDYFSKNKAATVRLYAVPTQSSSTTTLKKKNKPCMTKPCMTKPRQRSRFWARLSKKQQLGLKLLIAFVLVGAVVGLAVGISKRVGGGINKGNNQVANIT
jgi:hypothetical protein